MIKKLIVTVIAGSFALGAFAQHSDGSTKSLVNAEKEFAELVSKKGINVGFDAYAASDAISFVPNPVNTKSYYAGHPDSKSLSLIPVYARVSKSGDWGFTTGPFVFDGEKKIYGQCLSIWKAGANKKWALALDISSEHNKPLNKVMTEFKEPTSFYKPKFTNEKQILAGKEIIITTEKTLSATLKSYSIAAFSSFLNDDVRTIFPGREPIIGKANVMGFYNGMVSKIALKTINADKASGGDLAYTYGVATIDYKADLRESFNYVYIYERQPDHNWNIILQIYNPAER